MPPAKGRGVSAGPAPEPRAPIGRSSQKELKPRSVSASDRTVPYASPGPGSPRAPSRPPNSSPSAAALGKAARGWVNSGPETPTEGASPSRKTPAQTPTVADRGSPAGSLLRGILKGTPSDGEGGLAGSPYDSVLEPPPRIGRRSQSHDVVGRKSLLQGGSEQQDSEVAATQWWLSEAKRMREAAVKMRRERDRFRVAVEDAHFECRRLAGQVQELQSQLRHTQIALRESKSMADAARRELERLRHWIEEAHEESRRLSTDVQEYEWQLHETRLTLDEAERSCQELKDDNEDKHMELVALREEVQGIGDRGQRDRFKILTSDLEEARAATKKAEKELKSMKERKAEKELDIMSIELKATSTSLEDERLLSAGLRDELSTLKASIDDTVAREGDSADSSVV